MRILHVGKYYPPYRGGMETVLWNLAMGLLDHDCDVRVVVAGERSLDVETAIVGPRSGRRGGLVRVGRFGVINSQPVLPTLLSVLRRELREFAPDVVQLHFPNPLAALVWTLLTRWRRGPAPILSVWYHADITRQRVGRALVAPWVRDCLRQAAGISVSTRGLAAGSPLLRAVRDRVAVIPFGIAPQPWLDVVPRRDGGYLFVGRLVPYKGLHTLLAAVAAVPGAELDIVGDGPARQDLERRIRRLDLVGRVRLHGRLPEPDFVALLAAARALVLPSLNASETFGLVQLEAMGAGVPVIASNLASGVNEVGVPERTCLLVPPGDAAALAGALARLQSDADLGRRLGEEARRMFTERYQRDVMISRLLAWYEDLGRRT